MTAIVHSTREQWLMHRRELVTASDVAAVLGFDPRRGPLQVYLEKVHGYQQEQLRHMKRGLLMEPVIAAEYVEETGRPVFEPPPFQIAIHPDVPWIGATQDRRTEGTATEPAPAPGRAPLELKNLGGITVAKFREEPPTEYQVQVQVQLSCTAEAWGSLAAIIAGQALAWKDLPRHDRFLGAAYPRLEAFWIRVQRREPPEADGLPGTTAALKAVYADDGGETVELGADDLADVEAWGRAGLAVAKAEDEEERLLNRLRLRMGTATFGLLPDGSYVSLKKTNRRAYTREVKAGSYRTLRRFWPRLPRRTA